jgi:glyoxylate reductase
MSGPTLILASRRFPGPAFDELPEVEVLEAPLTELREPRPEVFGIAALYERIGDEVLDMLPNLAVVANYGVGYDMIDVAACRRRGATVANTPGAVDGATADLAFALVLAVRRRLVHADALIRKGEWRRGDRDLLVSEEVHRSTLGIVGCGRIGQTVARRASGFDMRLLYAQRNRLDPGLEASLGLEYAGLDDLLATADVVTLHTPLTPATTGLIDGRRLALMRDGASLVNTSRGAVVDERALVAELVSGRLSAGLDVFEREPGVPPALVGLPNVVLSPHVGSATHQTRAAMTRLVVDNLLAAAAGRPLVTPV